MDGDRKAVHERWKQRAEAAFQKMFSDKSTEELVTLTEREEMAVLLGRELAAFMLEEQIALDAAAQPKEPAVACCPKCGQPGKLAVKKEKLEPRIITTRAGEIRLQRQRWKCSTCRIIFFSAGCSSESGDGGF